MNFSISYFRCQAWPISLALLNTSGLRRAKVNSLAVAFVLGKTKPSMKVLLVWYYICYIVQVVSRVFETICRSLDNWSFVMEKTTFRVGTIVPTGDDPVSCPIKYQYDILFRLFACYTDFLGQRQHSPVSHA